MKQIICKINKRATLKFFVLYLGNQAYSNCKFLDILIDAIINKVILIFREKKSIYYNKNSISIFYPSVAFKLTHYRNEYIIKDKPGHS